jgi:hypothetical protein
VGAAAAAIAGRVVVVVGVAAAVGAAAVVVEIGRPRPEKIVVTSKGPYVTRQLSGLCNYRQ